MKMKYTKSVLLALLLFSTLFEGKSQNLPLVYSKERDTYEIKRNWPKKDNLSEIKTLPNPYAWADGIGCVVGFEDWKNRRNEIIDAFEYYEIGYLPIPPRDSIQAWMDADTLRVQINNNQKRLLLSAVIKYPNIGEGPFPAIIGMGWPTGSLPPEIFEDRGIALIAFNFGEVMSHTQVRGSEPINELYPNCIEIGAYRAWPWGVSRIIDGLEILDKESKIDLRHLGVTGCSFAGKMALFAGALDQRIALTIAQEPGGGGAACWRVSETLGNVETLGRTNYSWFLESMREFSDSNVTRLPIDHHLLVSLICPRALLVLGNTDYDWLADESGYVSCQAARTVWERFGISYRMGFSIEGEHPHCMLPESQIPEVEAFVDKFLLGKDTNTQITCAPMFENVDWQIWAPWSKY